MAKSRKVDSIKKTSKALVPIARAARATASRELRTYPMSQDELRMVMVRMAGLDERALAEAGVVLRDALTAEDTKYFAHAGEVQDERNVIAWRTRIDAATRLLDLFNVRVPREKPTTPKLEVEVIAAPWVPGQKVGARARTK